MSGDTINRPKATKHAGDTDNRPKAVKLSGDTINRHMATKHTGDTDNRPKAVKLSGDTDNLRNDAKYVVRPNGKLAWPLGYQAHSEVCRAERKALQGLLALKGDGYDRSRTQRTKA